MDPSNRCDDIVRINCDEDSFKNNTKKYLSNEKESLENFAARFNNEEFLLENLEELNENVVSYEYDEEPNNNNNNNDNDKQTEKDEELNLKDSLENEIANQEKKGVTLYNKQDEIQNDNYEFSNERDRALYSTSKYADGNISSLENDLYANDDIDFMDLFSYLGSLKFEFP